jgi:hypothetical protein
MAKRGKVTKPSKSTTTNTNFRQQKYAQYFLIVCEDQNTEPAYFEYFKQLFDNIERPKETVSLEIVGTGFSPLRIVEHTVDIKNKSAKQIDFIWVVFDVDDAAQNATTIKNFNDAFDLAARENIKIAYSNEVFELWLLLHLKKISANNPIPRANIYLELENAVKQHGTKYAQFQYTHGKSDIVDIIFEIGNESEAIQKAQDLLIFHKNKGTVPLYANPSTAIHILIDDLRQWLRFYLYD